MAELRPEVQAAFDAFVAGWRAGSPPPPQELLARVPADARTELAGAIDAFLDEAPRQPFDAAAFAASPARAVADDVAEALTGVSGAWPVVLPRLRTRAKLRRSELVARLAALLGVSASEARVGAYYHEMEHGTLDPAGVSDRVLEALASLVGTTAGDLRAAARAITPGGGAEPAAPAAFARTAVPDADVLASLRTPMGVDAAAPLDASEADREVDELFLGPSDHPAG
jgi:hypothetical protein